jgi:hypothetical protein
MAYLEVLSQHSPGQMKENYEKPHTGWSITEPEFEPTCIHIQA